MIKILDLTEWKIIKEINIVSKNNYEAEIIIGKIYYKRNITKDYKLGDDPEPDRIIKLLNYPQQELFSHDESDELILSSVKERYPKSFIRSYQVTFSADLERFEYAIRRPKEIATMHIRPDFSNIDYTTLAGKTFSSFDKEVNVYQEFTRESIQSLFFSSLCDFARHEDIVKKLEDIVFL